MSVFASTRALILVSILVTVATVWVSVDRQRDSALRGQRLVEVVDELRLAMVDQETGLRGFVQTREQTFLEPYETGRASWEATVRRARASLAGEDRHLRVLERSQTAAGELWQRDAELLLRRLAADRDAEVTAWSAQGRKRRMDRFRELNAQLHDEVDESVTARLDASRTAAAATVALVTVLLAGLGWALVGSQVRVSRRRRAEADEFSAALQGAEGEAEAHDLLRRQLERSVPGAQVVVLHHDPNAEAVTARTPVAEQALEDAIAASSSRTCLAMRRGRSFERGRDEPLQQCGICGATEQRSLCVPTVVGGEVVGSVLVLRDADVGADHRYRIEEAVAQTGPVLTSLRGLADAQHRAATDALTGLPNARSVREQLARMVAQAARQTSAISAVVLDLDHFKQVNDGFGHQAGDAALAAVGELLRTSLRASDLAGRWGGEEFVLLLPDTDVDGAVVLAEKVRAAVADLTIPGVPGGITASLGVASFPRHAGSPPELVRCADEALYAAKDAGRDQVVAHLAGGRDADALRDPDRLRAVAATRERADDRTPQVDALVRLAARLADAPTAGVSLIDGEHHRFVASHGLGDDVATAAIPVADSFCARSVEADGPIIAGNTTEHPLLAGNPSIAEHGMLAYAGMPVRSAAGHALGTLCVADGDRREWTSGQLLALERVAAEISAVLAAEG